MKGNEGVEFTEICTENKKQKAVPEGGNRLHLKTLEFSNY